MSAGPRATRAGEDHADPAAQVRGVRVFRAPRPGPRVGVVGSLHGNEPVGMRCVERLAEELASGTLSLLRGTLVLVVGNHEALQQNVRHTPGGGDLNRLFDFAFVDVLPEVRWGPEHHRALALEPVLASLDAGLDLHTATSPTPAFAVAVGAVGRRDEDDARRSMEVGRRLGVGYLTHGWEACSDVGAGVALARVRGPALAVECGQHAEDADARAMEIASRFLAELGMLPPPRTAAPRPVVLRVERSLLRPSSTFRFDRPLGGMTTWPERSRLGADERAEVFLPDGRWTVLLPNDDVPVGSPMVFLARRSEG